MGLEPSHYTTKMVTDDKIRLLAIGGVEPARETIRDGSCPISSYFYTVTAFRIGKSAPEETNPKIAALLEWILSAQGQEIIDRTGYVPLNDEKGSRFFGCPFVLHCPVTHRVPT